MSSKYLSQTIPVRSIDVRCHDLTVDGSMNIVGNLDISGNLEIVGDTTIDGSLTVVGDTTLDNSLLVMGDVDLCGNLTVPEIVYSERKIDLSTRTVTQTGVPSSAVVLNDTYYGKIITTTFVNPPFVAQVFQLQSNLLDANSIIKVHNVDYTGLLNSNGNPVVTTHTRASGRVDIAVINTHNTNDLSGSLTIFFEILKQ